MVGYTLFLHNIPLGPYHRVLDESQLQDVSVPDYRRWPSRAQSSWSLVPCASRVRQTASFGLLTQSEPMVRLNCDYPNNILSLWHLA